MPGAAGSLRIGTSGWHYKHWRGVLYPEDLPAREWLKRYAEVFDTVELNNSFYRLPPVESFRSWKEATPPGFLFSVKASRFITHVKRLEDSEEALRLLLENAGGLEERLGPVLFQLPPSFQSNPSRLGRFLSSLPPGLRTAWEFRHPSWFAPPVYELLRERDAALCVADSPRFPGVREITASFSYVRLHGGRVLYSSEYTGEELAEWADWMGALLEEGLDLFVYFNNDARGYAVSNALALRELLRRSRSAP